jgi:hypothetical protein
MEHTKSFGVGGLVSGGAWLGVDGHGEDGFNGGESVEA